MTKLQRYTLGIALFLFVFGKGYYCILNEVYLGEGHAAILLSLSIVEFIIGFVCMLEGSQE